MSAKFAFIDAEKARYSIVKMCAWTGVPVASTGTDRPATTS